MLTVRIGPLTVWGLAPHKIHSLVGCSPNAGVSCCRKRERERSGRLPLTRKRAELLAHVQNTNSQYNLPEIGKKSA